MPVWVDDPVSRIPTQPPPLPSAPLSPIPPPYFYDPSAPPRLPTAPPMPPPALIGFDPTAPSFTPDPTAPERPIAYPDQELFYPPPPPITYPDQDLLPPPLPPEPPPDPWIPVRAREPSLSGPLGSRADTLVDEPYITWEDAMKEEIAKVQAAVAALTDDIQNATVQDVTTGVTGQDVTTGVTGQDVTTGVTDDSFTFPDMYGTDPDLFPILWAQSFGIPERGRSRYEQFLADQWRPAAAEYLLRADPEFGGLPQVGGFNQPFSQFLSGRPELPGMHGIHRDNPYQANFLGQLTNLDPRVQVDILKGMGDQEDFVTREVFRHGLQSKYPSFIANNLTTQAFSPESRGYFETSPEAFSVGEEGILPFLNYLRSKYKV
jgi:hypothetical protein